MDAADSARTRSRRAGTGGVGARGGGARGRALRMLNGLQVRPDHEIATLARNRRNGARGKVPLPIASPVFHDEGHVAENFLKEFLVGYDGDRNGLVQRYYDDQSTFSFSVNTSAPRGGHASTIQTTSGGNNDEIKPQMWEPYIKKSRNLSRVHHLSARIARSHVGTNDIQQCWASLPATRHPSIFTEAPKWLIECHPIPGLPDPNRQFPGGVGGLMIVVHGEFEELNVPGGQAIIKRSFDRTFVLGPGGQTGIRVISDMLTYRAYGGYEAWQLEKVESPPPAAAAPVESGTATMIPSSQPQAPPQSASLEKQVLPRPQPNGPVTGQMQIPIQMQMPAGMGQPAPGKSAEQVQKEIMVMQMSQRTNMTLAYSKMCLDEVAYDFDRALTAFETVKVGYFREIPFFFLKSLDE